MDAGELISLARTRAALTQTELAARMGTHQSVIARWETGKTQPTFATVAKAVEAAGFHLAVSIGGMSDSEPKIETPLPSSQDLMNEMRRLHSEQALLRWIKAR